MAEKITSRKVCAGLQIASRTVILGGTIISAIQQIRISNKQIKELERQIAEQKKLETEYEAELNDFRAFKKAYEETMRKELEAREAIK